MSGSSRVITAGKPLASALALVIAATLGPAPDAAAQSRGNVQAEQGQLLRERLYGRGLPTTGRFVTSTGTGFILDRSGPRPLIRFEASDEIWALRPSSGPRGDVIYRNYAGDLVLRITRNGGVTLYTAANPDGIPASVVGAAPALQAAALSMNQLAGYLLGQSLIASNAVGHLVEIDVRMVSPEAYAALPEVVPAAVQTIVRMAASSNLREEASRVRIIQVVEGSRASAVFRSGVLRITIQPSDGAVSYPSSAQIVRVLAGS